MLHSKKPQTAPVSQPAVTDSSVGPSSVSTSAFTDGDWLREAVLSAIQSLSQSGSLGTNPLPSTAPFPVPDSESHWVSSGGDGSHQPHYVVGTTRNSAVGACVVSTENSTTPSVPLSVIYDVSFSHRSSQGMSHSLESRDSAFLGSQSSQSLSLGVDQLRVSEGGSLGHSSSLSPTSLMFPFPDSGFSSLPASSSSLPPSSLPSVSSSSSPFLPSSSSRIHPSSSVRSFFRGYSLFSFVFLALLFSPSFGLLGALFLFLVFLLLFCSSVGFPVLFFVVSFLPSSSWISAVLGLLLLLLLCLLRSLALFWHFFFYFSSRLFASLLFLFAFLSLPFLCRGFFLIGWAGSLSRECLGVVSDYQSLARWFVHSGGVDSLFFPSPLT